MGCLVQPIVVFGGALNPWSAKAHGSRWVRSSSTLSERTRTSGAERTGDLAMNEAVFRQQAQEQGYLDIGFKDYPPQLDGPMHTHDFSVKLLVVSGAFSLAREDGATTFQPGETCELAAHVLHTERTGALATRVLLAKKMAPAS
jgi:quercetin dioxygenase-like cupin family protein